MTGGPPVRRALFATVLLVWAAPPASADRIAPVARPAERALRVPVVVVGKVTEIEKATVDAPYYPGGPKVAHRVAVVKVGADLLGAGGATHIRVGFVTSDTASVRPGRGPDNPPLKAGEEWLFFLAKSPGGGALFSVPYTTPPLPATADKFKEQVAEVTRALAAVADPLKALKAERAEERHAVALVVLTKYRTRTEGVAFDRFEEVPVSAEESRALLRALAERPWTAPAGRADPGGYSALVQLGLTAADGWAYPGAAAGRDVVEATREALAKWLDGPGKGYRVKRFVEKR